MPSHWCLQLQSSSTQQSLCLQFNTITVQIPAPATVCHARTKLLIFRTVLRGSELWPASFIDWVRCLRAAPSPSSDSTHSRSHLSWYRPYPFSKLPQFGCTSAEASVPVCIPLGFLHLSLFSVFTLEAFAKFLQIWQMRSSQQDSERGWLPRPQFLCPIRTVQRGLRREGAQTILKPRTPRRHGKFNQMPAILVWGSWGKQWVLGIIRPGEARRGSKRQCSGPLTTLTLNGDAPSYGKQLSEK